MKEDKKSSSIIQTEVKHETFYDSVRKREMNFQYPDSKVECSNCNNVYSVKFDECPECGTHRFSLKR